jgi:ssDNA-binding replication factor A large subunit
MKKANVSGKILNIFPVREFNKNGREGKVGNLMIGDDSAAARVVFWDTNHIDLIEKGEIKVGDVLEISGAGIRNGELHLSSFADVKKSSEKIENVVESESHREVKLDSVKNGELVSSRAFIVQSFEPRYFEVCPQCSKKAVEGKCNEHGPISPEKRALLNVVIDDGNESLRCVLFGEQIEKLGLSKEEVFDLEKFADKKDSLLGKEMIFSGRVRTNELYNTTELTVNGAEEVKPEELIKTLEAKTG